MYVCMYVCMYVGLCTRLLCTETVAYKPSMIEHCAVLLTSFDEKFQHCLLLTVQIHMDVVLLSRPSAEVLSSHYSRA